MKTSTHSKWRHSSEVCPLSTEASPTPLLLQHSSFWLRRGVMVVQIPLLYIPKTSCDIITLSQKRLCGQINASVHFKNIALLCVFFLKNNHPWNAVSQDQEFWMNDVGGHFKEPCIQYNYSVHIIDLQGPEKNNNNW
jgi:hypothetical protein